MMNYIETAKTSGTVYAESPLRIFGKEYRASWLADAAPVGLVIIHSHVSHSVPGTEGFGPAGLVQPEAEQKWREQDKTFAVYLCGI